MFHRLSLMLALAAVGAPALACDGHEIADEDVYAAPICVPEDPQRVVVLDPSFGLGISLDVGLPVLAAPLDLMCDEALEARAEEMGVESIGVTAEPSLERIVALRPDLIVGFTGSDSAAAGIYPMPSRLAPTLLYTSLDWQAFYRLLAELTGREAEIVAGLAAYEERLADVRGRMPDTTVSGRAQHVVGLSGLSRCA